MASLLAAYADRPAPAVSASGVVQGSASSATGAVRGGGVSPQVCRKSPKCVPLPMRTMRPGAVSRS
ncbi:hypothetical protein OG967_43695 [Streptomyces phaeochromogenes]